MKKHVTILLLVFTLLTGCSANSVKESAASLYKKEAFLEIEIQTPESILPAQIALFEILLFQDGQEAENVETIEVSIWGKENNEKIEEHTLEKASNGRYSVATTFDKDGVYYLKVNASSNGATVMPTKQLIVGEVSEEELNELKKDGLKHNADHSDHH